MIQMTLQRAATLLSTQPTSHHDTLFIGISIDTRSLSAGNLFVAVTGHHLDGHDFVQDAYEKGAVAAVVSKHIDCPIPQIVVPDTTLALGTLAAAWRSTFTLPIVGMTGSNGKTTVKNMMKAIVTTHCQDHLDHVLATQGNFNNHWGLPLTLAKLNHEHRYAIIEMGMNHFGEIEYLTQLARPTIAIITNAGPAHLEGVGNTIAGVAQAKAEIFLGLPKNGTAILNRDDDFYAFWQEKTHSFNQLSFGLHKAADISATITHHHTVQRLSVTTPIGAVTIDLPLLGEHNAKNALAAIAASIALDIPLTTIAHGLSRMLPEKGRLCLSTLASGTTLIDDTYNANPSSFLAAIETLARFNRHTILVMGDMKELGENTKTWHELVGKQAKEAGINQLFTLGALSEAAHHTFGKEALHFTTHEALCDEIKQYCSEKTTILVKGSRSMQMEKVVHYLHEHDGI